MIHPKPFLQYLAEHPASAAGVLLCTVHVGGETALPPEIVELQRQLLDTEQDVSQLMAEIMEETVQVEMATANAELASLKNEISNLKQRLGEA